MTVAERMRAEWNRRAKQDAHFYAGFGRRNQAEEDFLAGAAEFMSTFEAEFPRLPEPLSARRALEIGCGPGRLMMAMSRCFGEVQGVEISDEMISLARERLRNVPNAGVHLTSGTDLSMFPDPRFDFVYSYLVFQHIPSKDVVLNYLIEARRVLKPGGILCCQLRGVAPLETEMSRETDTWTGCYFNAGEVAQFAREHSFPLVALSGLDTQYMWATFRKPLADFLPCAPERVMVKAVTATTGPEPRVPARGPDAAISLWIDGMPESASLADCAVTFGDRQQLGCYLSPVAPSGGCQLNARLPDAIAPGVYPVQLKVDGQAVPDAHRITVLPSPAWAPRVTSVSDAINLQSRYRIETGGAKVVIEDLARPEDVSIDIAGRPVTFVQIERKDPIRCAYEFSFYLSRRELQSRRQLLNVKVNGRELAPIELEIA